MAASRFFNLKITKSGSWRQSSIALSFLKQTNDKSKIFGTNLNLDSGQFHQLCGTNYEDDISFCFSDPNAYAMCPSQAQFYGLLICSFDFGVLSSSILVISPVVTLLEAFFDILPNRDSYCRTLFVKNTSTFFLVGFLDFNFSLECDL